MSNSNWPATKTAKTHLGEIEYRDIGEGPVLVFLHLVLAEASHWDKMPPLLGDRYRCIFPTLPMGAHQIPAAPDADLSVLGLARAVDDLLTHLEVDAVTLVGNDSGGAIAQVFAANFPQRLRSVVLTNCDMYDDFPPKLFAYFRVIPYLPGGINLMGRLLKIRALWPLPNVFGRLTNEVDGVKIDRWANALLANPRVRADAARVMKGFGPDVTNQAAARLRTSELPFLVVWGADDRAFKPALAERFCREVPNARLVMIEHCKTLICWDQPETLARLVHEFVESLTDETSTDKGLADVS